MMRSFVVALVTLVVSAAGPAAAQPAAATAQYPLDFMGGTPGVSIEIFLNNGKVGDLTVNSAGSGTSILDLGNMGKTRVEIYVDVCKDGKIVKVMFVTGSGQAPPEDESCRRRLAAISFQSDCGVIRINFDLRNFGARVVGCGLSFSDPKVFGPIVGAGVLIPVALAGGGDSPTIVNVPPPNVVNPPVGTTGTTTTGPPPNTQPADFQITFLTTVVNHPPGSLTSLLCGVLGQSPALSNSNFVLTGNGPGVVPGQNVTGTFSAGGRATFRMVINSYGTYTLMATITREGLTRSASTTINVGPASTDCPPLP